MKTFIRKINESRFYPSGLCVCYFLLVAVFIYMIDYYPRGEIVNILKTWVPWNLRVDFLLLIIGVVICRRDIAASIRELQEGQKTDNIPYFKRNHRIILLVALFALAFLMTSLVAPRVHRIYYDEDIYAAMGQAIAHASQTGMCDFGTLDYGEYSAVWLSYYKEPSGWPFLMSLVFQLFGTNELYAFLLNNLLFAAGVLVVFFITRTIAGNYFPAFLAALVFALIPHNLIWSNTLAVEPSAAFFAGLAVLCLAVYLKTSQNRHLYLLAIILPIACQMRAESGLILFWSAVTLMALLQDNKKESGWVKWVRGILGRKDIWTAGLATLILLMPHFLHLYAMSDQPWGAQGAKFSLDFFWKNLSVNGPYYLNNALFPASFTALALIGLVCARYNLKWRLMILFWFLLFWGIFLFFYAGSYRYGADVRFALVTYMPVAILAGMGGERIRSWIGRLTENCTDWRENEWGASANAKKSVGILISLLLIFTWVPFLPLVRTVGQEAWAARYDHYYAREFIEKIPRRSIILTHIPTMFLVWGQSAIQTYAGIQNPEVIQSLMEKYQGHVYFHHSFWCNIKTDPNMQLCENIREKYKLEEIAHAREQNYEYGLYKISNKPSHP